MRKVGKILIVCVCVLNAAYQATEIYKSYQDYKKCRCHD